MNELTVNKTLAEQVFDSVKVVNAEDAFEQVRVAIKTVYFVAGVKREKLPDKEEFAAMVNVLIKDIEHYHKKITVAELKIAFNNGVRELYGKYFGINVKTFNDWIRFYLESKERKDRIANNNYIQTGLNKNQIKDVREEMYVKVLYAPYCEYKDTGNWLFSEYNIVEKNEGLYSYFLEKGLLISLKGIKKSISDEAEKKYKKGTKKHLEECKFITFKKTIDEMVKNNISIREVFDWKDLRKYRKVES